jgi:hypothetical protein
MAQLLADVLKQSPDARLQGVVESVTLENDLFKVLPFYRVQNALGMKYMRVKARPTTAFIAAGGAVSEAAATLEEVDARIRHVVGDVDVLGAADRLADSSTKGTQIALKASATARLAADALVNGAYGTIVLPATNVTGVALCTSSTGPITGPDGGTGPRMPLSADAGTGSISSVYTGASDIKLKFRAPGDVNYGDLSDTVHTGNPIVLLRSGDRPNLWIRVKVTSASLAGSTQVDSVTCTSSTQEFDGLVRLVDDSQILDPTGAAGDNLTFSTVRRVIRLCKSPPGTRKFLIAGERDLEELCKLYDALGGATVQMQAVPEYGIDSMPVFAGKIPILVISDDTLLCTETLSTSTDCSRLYCASLGLPNPTVDAPQDGVGLFGLYAGTAESMAEGRNCAGMFIENLGPRAGYDLHGTRVGWDMGLVHYATEGLSCAWGLTPTP